MSEERPAAPTSLTPELEAVAQRVAELLRPAAAPAPAPTAPAFVPGPFAGAPASVPTYDPSTPCGHTVVEDGLDANGNRKTWKCDKPAGHEFRGDPAHGDSTRNCPTCKRALW